MLLSRKFCYLCCLLLMGIGLVLGVVACCLLFWGVIWCLRLMLLCLVLGWLLGDCGGLVMMFWLSTLLFGLVGFGCFVCPVDWCWCTCWLVG